MTQQRISDLPTLDELRRLVEKLPKTEITIRGDMIARWTTKGWLALDGQRAVCAVLELAPALAARVIDQADQLAAKDARIAELERENEILSDPEKAAAGTGFRFAPEEMNEQ